MIHYTYFTSVFLENPKCNHIMKCSILKPVHDKIQYFMKWSTNLEIIFNPTPRHIFNELFIATTAVLFMVLENVSSIVV